MTQPPSTFRHCPVIQSLAGEQRKTRAPQRSSGGADPRSGEIARILVRHSESCGKSFSAASVSTAPGAIALTLMLCWPRARASADVSATIASFETAYGVALCQAPPDDWFTIFPPPRSIIDG